MKKPEADFYSDKEAAKRRDEVVRRLANSPPRPKSSDDPLKMKSTSAAGRAVHKGRDDRER